MIISILLDSCALWPPQQKEKDAMDELFNLEEQEGFDKMQISEPTGEELRQLKTTPDEFRNRIEDMVICLTRANTPDEKNRIKDIKALMFPNRNHLTLSDEKDILILFNATKWRHSHLVTVNTKHFIVNGKAAKIFEKYKIKVMVPSDCLQEVLKNLEWRKRHNETMKRLKGVDL